MKDGGRRNGQKYIFTLAMEVQVENVEVQEKDKRPSTCYLKQK